MRSYVAGAIILLVAVSASAVLALPTPTPTPTATPAPSPSPTPIPVPVPTGVVPFPAGTPVPASNFLPLAAIPTPQPTPMGARLTCYDGGTDGSAGLANKCPAATSMSSSTGLPTFSLCQGDVLNMTVLTVAGAPLPTGTIRLGMITPIGGGSEADYFFNTPGTLMLGPFASAGTMCWVGNDTQYETTQLCVSVQPC